jgi:outer membrane protein assembly factor BamB
VPDRPSATFLYDAQRSGQAKYPVGTGTPELRWRLQLPTHPIRGVESTPAFDSLGNMYFGCHDGCFYSATIDGRLRWMFRTETKIYASPHIDNDDRITICGGDGYVYQFRPDGHYPLIYDTGPKLRPQSQMGRMMKLLHDLPATFDWTRRYVVRARSWASPVADSMGNLYVTGHGIGLHSFTAELHPRWQHSLGYPNYPLAGACVDLEDRIYAAGQSGPLVCLSADGKALWRTPLTKGYVWSSPTVNRHLGHIYAVTAVGLHKGTVHALDASGQIVWRSSLGSASHGSVVCAAPGVLVVAMLDGELLFLNAETGAICQRVRLSTAVRGLWTTPAVTPNGYLLVTSKQNETSGALHCLKSTGEEVWRIPMGKALSVPIIDAEGRIYVGDWTGAMMCYQT